MLQHGLMSVSTDTSTSKYSNTTDKAEGDQGLLKLPANDTVFYVGGYPNTFTVRTGRAVNLPVTERFRMLRLF